LIDEKDCRKETGTVDVYLHILYYVHKAIAKGRHEAIIPFCMEELLYGVARHFHPEDDELFIHTSVLYASTIHTYSTI
jgi:hypothetical protein